MGGRFATTHLSWWAQRLYSPVPPFHAWHKPMFPRPIVHLQPSTTSREAFIKWAVENRGENPRILAARWDRYVFLRANNDFINARNGRPFLLTPRDEFVLIGRAYDRDFHDIGWGVTTSGPLVVSRMTSTIDVQMGAKVLEIGTGSGNRSAYLSNLTDKVGAH
jgi:protein-L-isoaspartate(D-aspartate) O-methyltransferase